MQCERKDVVNIKGSSNVNFKSNVGSLWRILECDYIGKKFELFFETLKISKTQVYFFVRNRLTIVISPHNF